VDQREEDFILAQVGLKRDGELADVPLLIELASNDRDRQLMTFVSAETAISRALVTTPGVPPSGSPRCRRAFDATMRDPQFMAEADKAKMDISPMTGEDSQIIADQIVNTPPRCPLLRAGDPGRSVAMSVSSWIWIATNDCRVGKGAGTAFRHGKACRAPCPPAESTRAAQSLVGTAHERFRRME